MQVFGEKLIYNSCSDLASGGSIFLTRKLFQYWQYRIDSSSTYLLDCQLFCCKYFSDGREFIVQI